MVGFVLPTCFLYIIEKRSRDEFVRVRLPASRRERDPTLQATPWPGPVAFALPFVAALLWHALDHGIVS